MADAGRPSIYDASFIEKVKEYLDLCQDDEKQVLSMQNAEKGYEKFDYKLVVHLPTIEGLAVHLGINRDTIYDWCKIHPEFSDIIGQLRAKQAQELINKGLSGDYNSTIAKVLLTKHGYKDASESEQTIKQYVIERGSDHLQPAQESGGNSQEPSPV